MRDIRAGRNGACLQRSLKIVLRRERLNLYVDLLYGNVRFVPGRGIGGFLAPEAIGKQRNSGADFRAKRRRFGPILRQQIIEQNHVGRYLPDLPALGIERILCSRDQ